MQLPRQPIKVALYCILDLNGVRVLVQYPNEPTPVLGLEGTLNCLHGLTGGGEGQRGVERRDRGGGEGQRGVGEGQRGVERRDRGGGEGQRGVGEGQRGVGEGQRGVGRGRGGWGRGRGGGKEGRGRGVWKEEGIVHFLSQLIVQHCSSTK